MPSSSQCLQSKLNDILLILTCRLWCCHDWLCSFLVDGCCRSLIASESLARMGMSSRQWAQIQIKTLSNFWRIHNCHPYPLPDCLRFLGEIIRLSFTLCEIEVINLRTQREPRLPRPQPKVRPQQRKQPKAKSMPKRGLAPMLPLPPSYPPPADLWATAAQNLQLQSILILVVKCQSKTHAISCHCQSAVVNFKCQPSSWLLSEDGDLWRRPWEPQANSSCLAPLPANTLCPNDLATGPSCDLRSSLASLFVELSHLWHWSSCWAWWVMSIRSLLAIDCFQVQYQNQIWVAELLMSVGLCWMKLLTMFLS